MNVSLLKHVAVAACFAIPSILLAQPANDDCVGAIELFPDGACTPVSGTVSGATQSTPGTVSCDGFGATPDDDVWYRFTATNAAHSIRVAGSPSFDAVIQLLSGSCDGTPIVCRDVVSAGGVEVLNATGLIVGTEYLIRVFHWAATPPATPDFTICIDEPAVPANDECAGAVELVPAPVCTPVAGNVANATQSIPGTVLCDGFNATPNDDVWYRFTATSDAHTITVAGGAAFDAVIQLRSGACDGAPIVCRDVAATGQPEVLNATGLTIGEQYLVRVFHWAASVPATTAFTICLEGPEPAVCEADASTLSPNRPEVCFEDGPTLIDAAFDVPPTVPAGFEVVHVLTEGPGLVILATSPAPAFTVDALGNYTIHTLVYDPATLDLGIIEPGVTTGFDVNALLLQGGGSICGSLDVVGAAIAVIVCTECEADAGTLTADASTVCLDAGAADITATPDGNAVVPLGFEVIYVLTQGNDLVIQQVATDPAFTVAEAGDYTVHTLVYDPATLDLGIVELGVTTGGEVNALLVQGGGAICGSLDVAGAAVTAEECLACDADAGTITPDASSVCLEGGAADITATHDGNSVVPDGYQQAYVLTQGPGLVILAAGTTPAFPVTEAGIYTIHTLVYDPATLDLGIIEFGVTTGFDVNALLIQGGGAICASLDVTGATLAVEECVVCDADAGTITADLAQVCFVPDETVINATPNGDAVVPPGFETVYVLTQGAGLVILDAGATPDFLVPSEGDYTIHTLVYDPATLDLGIIEFGVTTGFDVNALLVQGGGDICASLDVTGAAFTVQVCIECDAEAGTLTAVDSIVCFADGMGMFAATANGDAVVPPGFETLYVLTEGTGLVIVDAAATPGFMVTATGNYTIHTLVYDPATLDLGIIEFGVTTGFDVNALLVQGGGDICASLDVTGAAFSVQVCCEADAGTLTIDETPVCLMMGSAQVGATPNGDAVVPDGFETAYAMTQGAGLTIVALSGGPVFTVSEPGTYTLHTLVYDPATIDPAGIELGVTTGFDINALLVQGGGAICGALDVAGATVVVNDCSPANDDCISAIPLAINGADDCPANAVAGDNTYADMDGGIPSCDDPGSTLLDVWYTFNAGENTEVALTLDPGTMEDWAVAVYDGCGGTEIACFITPTEPIILATSAFTDYVVQVYSNFTFGNGGQFTLCLTGDVPTVVCDGGLVQTSDGHFSVDVCQDTEADVIDFVNSSTSSEEYAFLLTDDNDVIVAVLSGNSLDFNSAAIGLYRVWGISYNGVLTGADPGALATEIASTGSCFELSDNYVLVSVDICDGIAAADRMEWSLFPNPGNGDFSITYAGTAGPVDLEVLDMDGRIVHAERVAMTKGQAQAFALAGKLARGLYTVRLLGPGGPAQLRLVVQ
ncbi:MAG: T9SS type A sorting domain-containing protein [Flavobacteriales bacterium]|nr:MAG: T9SS type A sorting domain-containing protein [Flavobacteriales bacterium]